MDSSFFIVTIENFLKGLESYIVELREGKDESSMRYKKFCEILHLFTPIIVVVIIYQYLKYSLIFTAKKYEEFIRKRNGYIRQLSRQLRTLAKKYENLYFIYMPMNHGTSLPPTYSLFMAIKEVLSTSNKPATRRIRSNLLMDLLHGEQKLYKFSDSSFGSYEFMDMAPDESDPFSEYNIHIMKCSRELIIYGVKDFDVMSTIYRIMESGIEVDKE